LTKKSFKKTSHQSCRTEVRFLCLSSVEAGAGA